MMCSKRCANPVRPGRSYPEPTWYQTLTEATGVEWSSATTTRSPLGRVKVVCGMLTCCAASGVASSPASRTRDLIMRSSGEGE